VRLAAAALLLAVGVVACDEDTAAPSGPFGRAIYGVDEANQLVRFGSGRPDQATVRPITGLAAGESLVGIDFNAANGRLYGVGTTSRIYAIDTTSAAATAVGTAAFAPSLAGTEFGVDFNPVPDRLRVHSNGKQNLRLNQLTGGIAAVDGALAYAAGDAGVGSSPAVVATAYTNSLSPAPASTTLYAIDAARDVLVRLANPNDGQMTTVGALGAATGEMAGFDIAGNDGTAYAALSTGGPGSTLYRIDLLTGAATRIGVVGRGGRLRGIGIAP
jgi:hypothetical protein